MLGLSCVAWDHLGLRHYRAHPHHRHSRARGMTRYHEWTSWSASPLPNSLGIYGRVDREVEEYRLDYWRTAGAHSGADVEMDP